MENKTNELLHTRKKTKMNYKNLSDSNLKESIQNISKLHNDILKEDHPLERYTNESLLQSIQSVLTLMFLLEHLKSNDFYFADMFYKMDDLYKVSYLFYMGNVSMDHEEIKKRVYFIQHYNINYDYLFTRLLEEGVHEQERIK